MFTSKAEGTGMIKTEAPKIEVTDSLSRSVIGKDLTIVGNAFSRGEIHVNGDFQGDIQCASLVVGERAKIVGALVADEIIVGGHVEGTIKGRHVALQSNSRIEGDIYHESLAIEQGAVFAGRSHQTEKVKAEPEKPASSTTISKSAISQSTKNVTGRAA